MLGSVSNNSSVNKRSTLLCRKAGVIAGLLFACCTGASAEPSSTLSPTQTFGAAAAADTRLNTHLNGLTQSPTDKTNWLTLSNQIADSAAGFDKHRLSDGRKLVGWKLSETLYFGRAKKEGATVALVWEKAADQRVSVSTDGIKFTRRFR